MARILRPDKGSIVTDGKVSALLELGAGFHPELSGRENVYPQRLDPRASARSSSRARFDEIVGFAGPRAVHRFAGEELLVGDVRAARDSRSRSTSTPTSSSSTRSSPSATPSSSDGAATSSLSCAPRARRSSSSRTRSSTVKEMCDEAALLEHGTLQMIGNADRRRRPVPRRRVRRPGWRRRPCWPRRPYDRVELLDTARERTDGRRAHRGHRHTAIPLRAVDAADRADADRVDP